MNMHPIGQPRVTARQLLQLGTHQVVYLKTGICDGKRRFVLYQADGQALMMVDAVEEAVEMAAEHGLAFVSVH